MLHSYKIIIISNLLKYCRWVLLNKVLINLFRVPKVAGSTVGDFADTVFWVIRSRFETTSDSSTIFDVNQLLDEIAKKHADNKSSN